MMKQLQFYCDSRPSQQHNEIVFFNKLIGRRRSSLFL